MFRKNPSTVPQRDKRGDVISLKKSIFRSFLMPPTSAEMLPPSPSPSPHVPFKQRGRLRITDSERDDAQPASGDWFCPTRKLSHRIIFDSNALGPGRSSGLRRQRIHQKIDVLWEVIYVAMTALSAGIDEPITPLSLYI